MPENQKWPALVPFPTMPSIPAEVWEYFEWIRRVQQEITGAHMESLRKFKGAK